MPDQNNPIDPSVSPAPVNPPSEPTQPTPVSVPPPMDIPAGDASIPPPFPPETPPMESAAPPSDTGSAAPGFDIPPVIAPVGKPRGGGKRVIATILGLLVLVGGIGAGIILIRQQQDIREKAASLCQEEVGGSCVPENYTCTTNYSIFNSSCGAGKKCGVGCTAPAAPAPAPAPEPEEPAPPPAGTCNFDSQCPSGQICSEGRCATGVTCNFDSQCPSGQVCSNGNCTTSTVGGGACQRVSSLTSSNTNATSVTITQAMINSCTSACSTAKLWVTSYQCDQITSGGCQDNGKVESNNATAGQAFSVPAPTCGKIQIDVGCISSAGTWGSVAFVSKSASASCSTPAPAGAGPTAQCLNIKAFDTEWNELTSAQLSELKVGDTVRFTVAGQASSGSFDKARFKVNGVQKPEVTGKRPGTEEYYDEYTIPEGITTFTINAQIHHTVLGWSN